MTTKLKHEVVGKLYVSGYNMKAIADMLGSVNGHISKVVRKLELPTRKRGEIVEVNYENLNLTKEDATYLIGNANLEIDENLKNMVRNLVLTQAPVKEKVVEVAPKEEIKEVVAPKVEEPVVEKVEEPVAVEVVAETVVAEPVAKGEAVLLKEIYTDKVQQVAVMMQLAEEGLSQRGIAKVMGIAQSTISKSIKKFKAEAEELRANGFRHEA